MTATLSPTTTCRCDCGRITEQPCDWTGPLSELVVVEWMPAYLRESHTAAGNSGVYPHNGAERLAVTRECADMVTEGDEEWCEVIDRDPAKYARVAD